MQNETGEKSSKKMKNQTLKNEIAHTDQQRNGELTAYQRLVREYIVKYYKKLPWELKVKAANEFFNNNGGKI